MKTRLLVLPLAALLAATACSHTGGKVTHIDGQTPAAVKAGFDAEYPGLTITHTDKIELPDHSLHYELKFRDAANAYHRKIFTAEGKLISEKGNVALPAKP